jgi:hypothetical protein
MTFSVSWPPCTEYATSVSHLENFSADSVLSVEWNWQKILVGMWQTFGLKSIVKRKGAQLTEMCGPLFCSSKRSFATSGTRKIVADWRFSPLSD